MIKKIVRKNIKWILYSISFVIAINIILTLLFLVFRITLKHTIYAHIFFMIFYIVLWTTKNIYEKYKIINKKFGDDYIQIKDKVNLYYSNVPQNQYPAAYNKIQTNYSILLFLLILIFSIIHFIFIIPIIF